MKLPSFLLLLYLGKVKESGRTSLAMGPADISPKHVWFCLILNFVYLEPGVGEWGVGYSGRQCFQSPERASNQPLCSLCLFGNGLEKEKVVSNWREPVTYTPQALHHVQWPECSFLFDPAGGTRSTTAARYGFQGS